MFKGLAVGGVDLQIADVVKELFVLWVLVSFCLALGLAKKILESLITSSMPETSMVCCSPCSLSLQRFFSKVNWKWRSLFDAKVPRMNSLMQ